MRRLVPALLAALWVLTGCGEAERGTDPIAGRGRWRHARITNVTGASGIAVLEGHLLLTAGGERAVFDVPLDAGTAEEGATLAARRVPLTVRPDILLGGGEPFAAQGYHLEDLWSQPVDFQGIAAQAPDFVYVADRTYRVVYAGRLHQTPDRDLRALGVDRLFVLPGADRSASAASDWRDHGPGVAGLAAVLGSRRTEDLYAVERSAEEAGTFRIHALDRFGLVLGAFTVDLGDRALSSDVGGLLRTEKRFLVVRGDGRGLIQPVQRGRWHSTVRAGRGVPGPEVDGAGAWSGMAQDLEGVIYLVSGGEDTYVAWREP